MPDDVIDGTVSLNGVELGKISDIIAGFAGGVSGDTVVLPGRSVALGWLAASLAVSSDKERPALYRRVLVDIHADGVVLAATDSYWVVRTWVPFDGDITMSTFPTVDEVPEDRFVLADVELRIRDLMQYVERITRPKKDPDADVREVMVTFTRARAYDPDVPTLDPSLAAPQVLVEIPGEERIVARESESEYPNLGQLWRHERAQVSDSLLFSPRLVGLAASSVQRAGFGAMRLVPTKTAAVRFVPQWFNAAGHVCDLEGLLMPLRDDEREEAPNE